MGGINYVLYIRTCINDNRFFNCYNLWNYYYIKNA